jgi:uncharacterized protein (TIGR03435 family)
MSNVLAAVTACLCVSSVIAQAPERAVAFEVATIKPSTRDSPPMALQRLGGRIVTSNTPLTWLVSWAFDLDDGRLIGAPKEAESARFDVNAKAPDGELAPGQLQRMMRALLSDRFHLIVHSEARPLPGYALVVDGNGPRFQIRPTTERPAPNPFRMASAGTLIGTQVNADMLAKTLSSQLQRPVQNMTGINGAFDFTLEWRPDSPGVIDSTRPSLFTALREQLGLRLDARELPAEVIVVDRLDLTPTAN